MLDGIPALLGRSLWIADTAIGNALIIVGILELLPMVVAAGVV